MVRSSSTILVWRHDDLYKIRFLPIQLGCRPLVSEKSHDCVVWMLGLLLAVRACCVHLQREHNSQPCDQSQDANGHVVCCCKCVFDNESLKLLKLSLRYA